MDLGTVYGIISSLGTLISAIEKLVETLKTHGVDVPADIHTNLAAARDAHTQLVATTGAAHS
jgi:biotin operon repressor